MSDPVSANPGTFIPACMLPSLPTEKYDDMFSSVALVIQIQDPLRSTHAPTRQTGTMHQAALVIHHFSSSSDQGADGRLDTVPSTSLGLCSPPSSISPLLLVCEPLPPREMTEAHTSRGSTHRRYMGRTNTRYTAEPAHSQARINAQLPWRRTSGLRRCFL